jgi:hypothetical protein
MVHAESEVASSATTTRVMDRMSIDLLLLIVALYGMSDLRRTRRSPLRSRSSRVVIYCKVDSARTSFIPGQPQTPASIPVQVRVVFDFRELIRSQLDPETPRPTLQNPQSHLTT